MSKSNDENKISVEKISIKIGRKTLDLTPEEMKELRDILDQTFPKEKTVYLPSQPIIIQRDYPWVWKKYDHWCEPKWTMNQKTGGSTLCLSSNTK